MCVRHVELDTPLLATAQLVQMILYVVCVLRDPTLLMAMLAVPTQDAHRVAQDTSQLAAAQLVQMILYVVCVLRATTLVMAMLAVPTQAAHLVEQDTPQLAAAQLEQVTAHALYVRLDMRAHRVAARVDVANVR